MAMIRGMNGEWMAAEMAEQPRVLAGLAARRNEIRAAVRALIPETPHGVVFAARGSSANAAMHGRLVAELATRRPATIAALSVPAAYGIDVDYAGWLGVSVSQSGRTPEIVAALDGHRRSGAATIAVTNDTTSPLAVAADLCVALQAGIERAVPATKTYTAQVAVLAIIGDAFRRRSADDAAWGRLADGVQACLDDESPVLGVADALASVDALVTSGRGFGHPAAREGALKIKELTSIAAEGYSHLDLLHGPIAVVGPDVPALVVALRGPTEPDTRRLVAELSARGAPVWTIGDIDGADIPIGVAGAGDLPESLNGILVAVRMQQIARLVSLARGIDPDHPNALAKVTLT
ncbi:MAG: hypothetical protein JWM34_1265 [Ilumatobacteraceae bacterium]|nr:hypothetical protein [Ilumatobacteraceae bacterium]